MGFSLGKKLQFLSSFSATNLKEVVVSFDGTVDKASAENEENYTLATGAEVVNLGAKTVKVVFSEPI